MRWPRPALAALALPVVLLGAAACTGSGQAAGAAGSTTAASGTAAASSDVAIPAAPTPAGSAEARALEPLPAGLASGTAVVAYSGVGEVRAPFTGRCSHDGGGTTIDGSADTAHIRVVVAPDGAQLALTDVGLSATSTLATGRYAVSGRHLSLAAPLAHDGQTVGSVELEIDCGG